MKIHELINELSKFDPESIVAYPIDSKNVLMIKGTGEIALKKVGDRIFTAEPAFGKEVGVVCIF